LHFHIAERTDDLIAGGMPEHEARRAAARTFGNYTAQKESTRDMDIAGTVESLLRDFRYGARQLRRNPGFATVAVLSLALGIGANSAIFQLINALRLRSLPVEDPAQLVAIDTAPDFYTSGWYAARNRAFTYAQIEQIAAHQQAFSGMLAFGTTRFNLSRGGEARKADGLYVTPNYLEVLGVTPLLGSWMAPDTNPSDCSGAGALLDYAFWQREYGGDPSAIGRDISLNGRNFPILAVTPPSFYGLEPAQRFDVALPLCADALFSEDGKGRLALKWAWWLTPIARLKPDWTVERASSHLRDISPIIFEESLPDSYRPDAVKKYLDNKLRVVPAFAGVSSVRKDYENPLWILLAVTGLVLLIACANLANLLLARASAREREVALRQAIGASRTRLVAQLMSESFLLAGLGALLGAFLAYALGRALVVFLSSGESELYLPLGIDWRVFGFIAALALLTCLLFGLTPALRATRTAPADAMRGGRGSASSSQRHGLRRALVVSQIALSFVLLVGALLFGQSLRNLLTTDTGFVGKGVLVATVSARIPNLEPQRRMTVFEQLREQIDHLPDVQSAASVLMSPFGGSSWDRRVQAQGDEASPEAKSVWFNRVGPGYFETMQTPLLAGRDFDAHDSNAPNVAIVNEKFAQEVFGGKDPLGRTFRYEADAGETDPVYQVVGVVKNTKYSGLREGNQPIAFLPFKREGDTLDELSFVIRSRGAFHAVMAGVQREMAKIDPGLLVEYHVLDEQIEQSVMRERLMANLSGAFGLLAALLSTLGLYGVMSYMVARRRTEIGVRMALGAETRDILALIFGEAGRLLLIGLAVGLLGSFAVSRYAESLLFGLQPNDAMTLAIGCGLLAATGIVAALIPARRAARLDAAVVLRDE
jgi:putative ABC transport system permease protein